MSQNYPHLETAILDPCLQPPVNKRTNTCRENVDLVHICVNNFQQSYSVYPNKLCPIWLYKDHRIVWNPEWPLQHKVLPPIFTIACVQYPENYYRKRTKTSFVSSSRTSKSSNRVERGRCHEEWHVGRKENSHYRTSTLVQNLAVIRPSGKWP
jgi:hypothetical protein